MYVRTYGIGDRKKYIVPIDTLENLHFNPRSKSHLNSYEGYSRDNVGVTLLISCRVVKEIMTIKSPWPVVDEHLKTHVLAPLFRGHVTSHL